MKGDTKYKTKKSGMKAEEKGLTSSGTVAIIEAGKAKTGKSNAADFPTESTRPVRGTGKRGVNTSPSRVPSPQSG